MARTPSALIVDQDIQARFEMKQVIKASGLTVAGECSYGMEAITVAGETHPDIIAVSINASIERALQTVEALGALLPSTPIIVCSTSKEIDTVRKAMLAGARDFLPKPMRPETFRDSVLKTMEAEENRRLRVAGQLDGTPTAGTIVTIFGAKGGVGKSTLATNLAVSFAQQRSGSVVIVDLDNGFGDITGMLNVRPQRTLVDLVRDADKVTRDDLERYLAPYELPGLFVLGAPSILDWRGMSTDDLRKVIELLARSFDKVVLDTSGTLNEISELALEMATIVLWITTTEFASVHDTIEAVRALKTLAYPDERIRFVLNAISPDDGVRAATVRDALGRDVFWQLPYDKKVRQGAHLGRPIVTVSPQSIAAKSFADLATVISGGRIGEERHGFGGFRWRRGFSAPVAEVE